MGRWSSGEAGEAEEALPGDRRDQPRLAKVFGELYFLLEYRDAELRLLYSDKPFTLPDNLYIIGTMNTADRSIALVDLALRRRFHFVEFHPDKPPVQGALGRWLQRHSPEMAWVTCEREAGRAAGGHWAELLHEARSRR